MNSLWKTLLVLTLCLGSACAKDNNKPPVARAKSVPPYVAEGRPRILNGSDSSDPDGDPLTYSWEQIEMGGLSPAIIKGSNRAKAQIIAPQIPGSQAQLRHVNIKFRLTVSDGKQSQSADVTVRVMN